MLKRLTVRFVNGGPGWRQSKGGVAFHFVRELIAGSQCPVCSEFSRLKVMTRIFHRITNACINSPGFVAKIKSTIKHLKVSLKHAGSWASFVSAIAVAVAPVCRVDHARHLVVQGHQHTAWYISWCGYALQLTITAKTRCRLQTDVEQTTFRRQPIIINCNNRGNLPSSFFALRKAFSNVWVQTRRTFV